MNTIMFEKNNKILIVAPHPDDETIGTGGVLSVAGHQCDVLVLTDGSKGIWADCCINSSDIASIRKDEFITTAKVFHIHQYFFLDIPDQELNRYKKWVYRFDLSKYDYIFIPYRRDRHIDHKVANRLIREMIRRQRIKDVEVYEYEVWTPLQKANCYIDLSNLIENKLIAAQNYKSQMKSYDYCQMIRGLAEYRGVFENKQYIEVYYSHSIAKKRMKEKIAIALWSKLPKGFRIAIRRRRNINDT